MMELVGCHLLAQIDGGTVVVEHGTSDKTRERLREVGGKVEPCGPRRAEVASAMRESSAVLGGGSDGRLWYSAAGVTTADALRTVTLLLEILSQSDRPLSGVLDG